MKINRGPNIQWYVITFIVALIWGWTGLAIWGGINVFIFVAAYLIICCRYYKNHFIITSILDTDFYKLTMQQVVLRNFPDAVAKYKFINRGGTKFPKNFDLVLKDQIGFLGFVTLKDEEAEWLHENNFDADYIEWLSEYRFDPNQVSVKQTDGDLELTIEGPWVETILWEVPLMAMISELYFAMTGQFVNEDHNHPCLSIAFKAAFLDKADVKWSDFGTRRRYSKGMQDAVNSIMGKHKGFIGTSNPYFAMMHNLKPVGTFAHEAVMAMQAKYPLEETNRRWLEYWLKEYYRDGQMLIALTDTLTTDVFLRDFDKDMSNKYSGVRQDSGDPFEFGKKIIAHYKKLGIDPKTKKIVFSDSLNVTKAIELQKAFGDEINCVMGIGTHLTNDCGFTPLNMVVKLTAVDFGNGFKNVVKLSDDSGKHTGDPETINEVKKELNILEDVMEKYKHMLMTQEEKERWENAADVVRALLTENDSSEDRKGLEEELEALSDETLKRLAKLLPQPSLVLPKLVEH